MCNHRIASETLAWSLERWGTTPRDVPVMKPGVETVIVLFSSVRCTDRDPNLGEKEESGGWIWNRSECIPIPIPGFTLWTFPSMSCDSIQ